MKKNSIYRMKKAKLKIYLKEVNYVYNAFLDRNSIFTLTANELYSLIF